jgi:hypothetical protein
VNDKQKRALEMAENGLVRYGYCERDCAFVLDEKDEAQCTCGLSAVIQAIQDALAEEKEVKP